MKVSKYDYAKACALWHIDHILPCASFDLTDTEQQKRCFHYTNLQPLTAFENWSKHARIKDDVQPELAIAMPPPLGRLPLSKKRSR